MGVTGATRGRGGIFDSPPAFCAYFGCCWASRGLWMSALGFQAYSPDVPFGGAAAGRRLGRRVFVGLSVLRRAVPSCAS